MFIRKNSCLRHHKWWGRGLTKNGLAQKKITQNLYFVAHTELAQNGLAQKGLAQKGLSLLLRMNLLRITFIPNWICSEWIYSYNLVCLKLNFIRGFVQNGFTQNHIGPKLDLLKGFTQKGLAQKRCIHVYIMVYTSAMDVIIHVIIIQCCLNLPSQETK
jgi:hypothetical protein